MRGGARSTITIENTRNATRFDDAGLYVGRVMHHRLQPKPHRFTSGVFTLLLDIDRLTEVDSRLHLFSVERANLFSFRSEDHGPRDGRPLRPWVEAELRRAGIDRIPATIRLLAMPRFLGYVFNPLSVYYCYGADQNLLAIVYEVKNTFGGQHPYVLPVEPEAALAGKVRQHCRKNFYVSPFIEADTTYRFHLNDPSERLSVLIREEIGAGPLLIATLSGERRPLTDKQLAIQAFSHPFLTQKVIASIHIEALKLWLKGIRLQPRPVDAPLAGNQLPVDPVEPRRSSV